MQSIQWQLLSHDEYVGAVCGAGANPHISPIDAMIAPDFLCQRAPATESVAVATVEGARARWRKKDQRGRIKHSL